MHGRKALAPITCSALVFGRCVLWRLSPNRPITPIPLPTCLCCIYSKVIGSARVASRPESRLVGHSSAPLIRTQPVMTSLFIPTNRLKGLKHNRFRNHVIKQPVDIPGMTCDEFCAANDTVAAIWNARVKARYLANSFAPAWCRRWQVFTAALCQ